MEDSPFIRRSPDAFRVEFYSGTGPGGQNRNKLKASCRLSHTPTGTIKTAQTRSRENSYRLAMEAMVQELDARSAGHVHAATNGSRRNQVGSGERSDKRRTFRFQDDRATDHRSGKTASCTKVMAGRFDLLA